MTWRDYLNNKQLAELERAERKRDTARAEYNAIRIRLKSAAEFTKRKAEADRKRKSD